MNPVFGVKVDDVELLGVEVIFDAQDDNRGTTWIPFQPGMSLLYGRNGAGKTTILDALHSALSGAKSPGQICRLYLRILATESEVLSDDEERSREYERLFEEWGQELEDLDEDELEEVNLGGEMRKVLPGPPSRPPGNVPAGGWFFQRVISAVPKGCEFFDFERVNAYEGSFTVTNWEHPAPQFTIEQHDAEEWADFQYPAWVEIVRLLLLGNAQMDLCERETYVGDGGTEVNPVNPDVYLLCNEVEDSRLMCLESDGSEKKPSWTIKLAAQVVGETAGSQLLEKSIAILQDDLDGRISERVKAHIEDKLGSGGGTLDRSNVVLASVLGSSLLSERASRELVLHQEGLSPYSPIGREWSTIKTEHLPFVVKKVGVADACENVVHNLIQSVVQSTNDGFLMIQKDWDGDRVECEIPGVQQANENLERLSIKFRGLGLGISGIRLSLLGGLQAALSGGMLKLEVQDEVTGKWLDLSKISAAQKSWLAFALSMQTWSEEKVAILLADEVDRGLAERVVPSMLMFVESLFPISLVATHSPSALRSGVGAIQHLYRDEMGTIHLSPTAGLRDSRRTADQLGISVAEMLTFLKVVVLVEGEHDKVVFESLLEKTTRGSDLETRVVPFRGVNRLTTVDSQILLDYSDASIVLVVDGARLERVDQALSKAREVEGLRKTRARLQEVTKPLRTSDAIAEELVLADVIEQALERGILGRIHLVGLEVRDIMEAFPPEDFGLDKNWTDYVQEWREAIRRDGQSEPFKDFLRRMHGAKINTESIRRAAERVTSPPPQLWKALEEIEIARMISGVRGIK